MEPDELLELALEPLSTEPKRRKIDPEVTAETSTKPESRVDPEVHSSDNMTS